MSNFSILNLSILLFFLGMHYLTYEMDLFSFKLKLARVQILKKKTYSKCMYLWLYVFKLSLYQSIEPSSSFVLNFSNFLL
jgi:hypothetical protein